MNNSVYLKVRKERQDWLGIRYFRLDWSSDKTLQICLSNGAEIKRGRGNNIGVYLISKMTLLSNYMAMDYVQPCTKREFENRFDKIVKLLK